MIFKAGLSRVRRTSRLGMSAISLGPSATTCPRTKPSGLPIDIRSRLRQPSRLVAARSEPPSWMLPNLPEREDAWRENEKQVYHRPPTGLTNQSRISTLPRSSTTEY